MSLSTYKKKRVFSRTPEPTGGKSGGSELRFVVQKHAATNLHYDFRLEMGGVLKSWVVPKGPSTDPSIKRLAMMVEDHPFDYRTFEGIIPKGQYGGGTVMVWDEGSYEPAEGKFKGKKEMEKELLHQLHKGKLVFNLKGEKLKGEFALVKSSYRGENSWLLMKVKDKYAKTTEILKKEKSVISGRTLEQIGNDDSSAVYGKAAQKKAAVKKSPKAPANASSAKKITTSKGNNGTSFVGRMKTIVGHINGTRRIGIFVCSGIKRDINIGRITIIFVRTGLRIFQTLVFHYTF